MNFKSSQTFALLNTAFSAECRAYTKYMLYSRKASADGFSQVAEIFRKTAGNELNHARIIYMLLNSLDQLPYTSRNVQDASDREKYESEIMYKKLAITARQEGFDKIAEISGLLSDVENSHMKTFDKISENMDCARIFCRDEKQKWICGLCGYEVYDWCSREICPLCGGGQEYTRIKEENY